MEDLEKDPEMRGASV